MAMFNVGMVGLNLGKVLDDLGIREDLQKALGEIDLNQAITPELLDDLREAIGEVEADPDQTAPPEESAAGSPGAQPVSAPEAEIKGFPDMGERIQEIQGQMQEIVESLTDIVETMQDSGTDVIQNLRGDAGSEGELVADDVEDAVADGPEIAQADIDAASADA